MKLRRFFLIATPTVLMSVTVLVRAETGTIISPEEAPAPVENRQDNRIAEQERHRAQSERNRANEERRRREAAEQSAARLKSDAAEAQRQRQRAQQEHKRAEEERRRRDLVEQGVARLKSDAAESERQRQRAEQERKRADEERRRREAAEQTVARLKSDAAAQLEKQRQSAEQERKRASQERQRRDAAEQTMARIQGDAAAFAERQRQGMEQEHKRAEDERGKREAAELAAARLKAEAAEAERKRETSAAALAALPVPCAPDLRGNGTILAPGKPCVEQDYRRADEQRGNMPWREWHSPATQAQASTDRVVDRVRAETARLEAIFAGAELRRDCDVCPRVVAIPPGPLVVAFAPIDEPRTGTDVRRVPLRAQSWLAVSKFETTFADWDRCVSEGGCGGYTPSDNGHGRGSKPVVNVNYTDVEAYVRWLNNRAGYTPADPRRYRLLTEQEWEYAARAGSTTRFFWGDDPNYTDGCAWANVADSSLRASSGRFSIPDGQLFRCADQSPFSSPVGRYRPNPWGLHDMIGNAAEIVLTRPGADYIMIRGGSWLSERGFHHSAAKAYTRSRDAREYTIGFRVVREVTMPTE